MLPKDPFILLSYVNTKLRDRDPNLDTFCEEEGTEKTALCAVLAELGYVYSESRNQFV